MVIKGLLKDGDRAVDVSTGKGFTFDTETQTSSDCLCCSDCYPCPETLSGVVSGVTGVCSASNNSYSLTTPLCSYYTGTTSGWVLYVTQGITNWVAFVYPSGTSNPTLYLAAIMNDVLDDCPNTGTYTLKNISGLFCGAAGADNGQVVIS